MPNTPISPNPHTEKTEQGILNRSFDKTYDVLAVEPLVENEAGTALLRLTGDGTGNLNVNIGASDVAMGGGVQYTEGDVDASITGTAIMWETDTGSNTLGVVSQDVPLPVDIMSGVTITPSGVIEVKSVDYNGNVATLTDDGAFSPANHGVHMAGYTFDDVAPDSVDEGDAGAARMSANRNQYVQIRDNAGNERGLNVDANGEIGVGAIRSALPAGTNAIGGITGAGSNAQIKDDSFYGENLASGVMSVHGRLWDGSAYDRAPGNSTDGALVNLGTNNDVTVTPSTSNGLTTYHLASAGSTNATVVKASAGKLYGWFISNTSSSYTYLAFHNTASAPTAGASIFFKIGIPPSSGANVEFTNGIEFSTGIAFTTVTGAADNDNTGVAANDQIINLFYK